VSSPIVNTNSNPTSPMIPVATPPPTTPPQSTVTENTVDDAANNSYIRYSSFSHFFIFIPVPPLLTISLSYNKNNTTAITSTTTEAASSSTDKLTESGTREGREERRRKCTNVTLSKHKHS
jgi:hypothetical protein